MLADVHLDHRPQTTDHRRGFNRDGAHTNIQLIHAGHGKTARAWLDLGWS